jgi:GcrA cell cycle regulator
VRVSVVWTPEKLATLKGHYDGGLPYKQIAAEMGASFDSISSQLAKQGFCNRSNDSWWTAERLEKLRLRYLDGDSFSQLAREFGTTRSAVAGKVKRLGITRDPTGPRKVSGLRDDLARRAKISQLASKNYYHTPRVPRQYVKPKPKPAPIPMETRRISFQEMQFSKFCAYPVHGPGEPPLYCGHDKGLTAEGRPSSYCPGHHQLTHQPSRASCA